MITFICRHGSKSVFKMQNVYRKFYSIRFLFAVVACVFSLFLLANLVLLHFMLLLLSCTNATATMYKHGVCPLRFFVSVCYWMHDKTCFAPYKVNPAPMLYTIVHSWCAYYARKFKRSLISTQKKHTLCERASVFTRTKQNATTLGDQQLRRTLLSHSALANSKEKRIIKKNERKK